MDHLFRLVCEIKQEVISVTIDFGNTFVTISYSDN